MNPFEKRLRDYLGLTEGEALSLLKEATLASIPPIDSSPETKKALAIVEEVKSAGGSVLVYGDYDCDGASSASILVRALRDHGLKAKGYLPSRYLDGYGLNLENARKIAAAGYSLVITVDNGITLLEEIAFLKKAGVKAIVIDHHEKGPTLPAADAIIHQDTLPYPRPGVSAGYLAYLFSVALLGKSVPYLLVLAALSTLSDMMSLKLHNREIVRLAESCLKEASFPALTPLLGKSERAYEALSAAAPSINAVGRLEERPRVSYLIDYLAYGDASLDERLLAYITSLNARRKQILEESGGRLSYETSSSALTLLSPYPEGLNGLLASRLLQLEGKPVAVFAPSREEGILVGSIRMNEGYFLPDFLAKQASILIRGGGHALAGGVSIRKEDFDAFKREFSLYALLAHPKEEAKKEPLQISEEEVSIEDAELVAAYGPYGVDAPEPRFLLTGIPFDALSFPKGGQYVAARLRSGGRLFSYSLSSRDFEPGASYSFSGRLTLSSFRGKKEATLLVDEAKRE